jgi:hypothetical protein
VKVASLVMVIIGTVFGVIFGLIAMAAGGAANALGGSGTTVVWLGVSAILACVVGMLCSGFHFAGNRTGWMTFGIFVAAIWHVVSISAFGIPGFIFLFLGAIFALFSRGRKSAAPAFTGTPATS